MNPGRNPLTFFKMLPAHSPSLWQLDSEALEVPFLVETVKQFVFSIGPTRSETLFLGPPVVPFYPFLREGSPTKIDYRKMGTLILTSLLEDLVLLRCLASNESNKYIFTERCQDLLRRWSPH